MNSSRPSDFRMLPVWRQARHFALAIVAMGHGFPPTASARQWVRRMEQAYLTMLSTIAAAYDGRSRFREARKSIDRIETVLQQAGNKRLLTRHDLERLTTELDSVRCLLASQEAQPLSPTQINSNSFIPTSTGVSHD